MGDTPKRRYIIYQIYKPLVFITPQQLILFN